MSKYRHLTDAELVHAAYVQSQHSPLIKELVTRLAIHCDADIIDECQTKEVDCPVCEAQLRVSVDYEAEVYALSVS